VLAILGSFQRDWIDREFTKRLPGNRHIRMVQVFKEV
jgi:hypothetical protein